MTEINAGWTVAYHTASDGYRWCYRKYSANGTGCARVVCLHGIQSHAGWYSRSCRGMAEAGYDVSFLDRRGAGRNEIAVGDTPCFRRLLDDVAEFLRSQRADDPRPIYLLGISWGGKLAAALPHRHPGLVDGLILVAPGFCPRIAPPLGERLAILVSRLCCPRRLFPVPLNDPELFTTTPHRQQFLRDDPVALRQATARFFVESVRLDWYLRRAAARVTMPVLTLLAGNDRIIDNARTRAFVERFPARDKAIIEYAGAHHTLEFEPDPEPFIADVIGWLDREFAQMKTLYIR